MYHYIESGLDNVWLVNGYTRHQTSYGKGVSFKEVEKLHATIERILKTRMESHGSADAPIHLRLHGGWKQAA